MSKFINVSLGIKGSGVHPIVLNADAILTLNALTEENVIIVLKKGMRDYLEESLSDKDKKVKIQTVFTSEKECKRAQLL